MKAAIIFFVLWMMSYSAAVYAKDEITLLGLFADKALILFDGTPLLVAPGDAVSEDITLQKVTADSAWFRIHGASEQIAMTRDAVFKPAETNYVVATVEPDEVGMYLANGYINDRLVSFIIDTGASHVALSTDYADRLAINYQADPIMVPVETASGRAAAYALRLDKVQLGNIILRDIPALIIEGHEPKIPLLGMSFLGQLQIQHHGKELRLIQIRPVQHE